MSRATDLERPNHFRQLLKHAMTSVLPRGVFMTAGPSDDRAVALTFDDGPHPEHTPHLLDLLGELEVPATFFLLGKEVARYPEIVARIAREGHAIGHHGYDHREPSQVSAAALVEEVARTNLLFEEILGRKIHLFRPPHGKLTAPKILRLWASRQSIVLWNKDPKDFACKDASEVLAFFEQAPFSGGDILLMHDNHPHAAGAVPKIAEMVRARGLSFVTVDRWVGGSPTSAASHR